MKLNKFFFTIQMTVDEVEDVFEELAKQESISKKTEMQDIESKIDQMETFYKSPGTEQGEGKREEDRLQ